MPSPEQILNGLALAANNFYVVSIVWHLLVLLFFIVLFSGRKLSNKQVMAFLSLPLLTTALFALMISNPFNGIVFSVITIILWFTIYNTPGELVALKWDAISFAGLAFILFGLFYPHFLEGNGYLQYLYKAPTGLIPCPTLSLVIGFTLLFHGFNHRKWMWYLSCLGLFYGIFGVLRLGVKLDIVLIAGALTLLIYSISIKKMTSQNG